ASNVPHRPAIVPAARTSRGPSVLGTCAHASWNVSPILTPGVIQDLRGVAATSPSDAWAVGFYDPTRGSATPLVEHFNGQAWSLSSVPLGSFTGGGLSGITALASTNVWAVGFGAGTGGTLVEHWDGAKWTLITSPNHGSDPSELRSIAAVAPDDLWAVGTY